MRNPIKAILNTVKGDVVDVSSQTGKNVGLAILAAAAQWWDENNENFKGVIEPEGEIEITLKIKMPKFRVAIEDSTEGQ